MAILLVSLLVIGGRRYSRLRSRLRHYRALRLSPNDYADLEGSRSRSRSTATTPQTATSNSTFAYDYTQAIPVGGAGVAVGEDGYDIPTTLKVKPFQSLPDNAMFSSKKSTDYANCTSGRRVAINNDSTNDYLEPVD